MASATEELLAVPDTRAARLAKVSRDRLKYWDENNLVSPSIKRQISPRNIVRLYDFQDLLSLLVVSERRTERSMSLRHIRRVVKHLQSRGYAAPLRELRFATIGRHIYFQHPDGAWEGDIQPDQIIQEKTLPLTPPPSDRVFPAASHAAPQRLSLGGSRESKSWTLAGAAGQHFSELPGRLSCRMRDI